MAKSKKIDLKKVILKIDDKNVLSIEGFHGEEIPFENLTDEVKEMIKLGSPLNIKISKGRSSGGASRKPTYKFICKQCGKEISTKEEDLKAICKDCNIEFELKE